MSKKHHLLFFLTSLIFILGFLSFRLLAPRFRQSLSATPTPTLLPSPQVPAETVTPPGQVMDQPTVSSPSPTPPPDSSRAVNFDINVLEPHIGSISGIQFALSRKSGSVTMQSLEIIIPPGWEFTKGELVGDGKMIGKGELKVISNGSAQQIPVSIVNDKDTAGHTVHWKFYFRSIESAVAVYDAFIDSDKNNGSKIMFAREFLQLKKGQPPPQYDLTITITSRAEGLESDSLVFSGPSKKGEYAFRGIIKLLDGNLLRFEKIISIN